MRPMVHKFHSCSTPRRRVATGETRWRPLRLGSSQYQRTPGRGSCTPQEHWKEESSKGTRRVLLV